MEGSNLKIFRIWEIIKLKLIHINRSNKRDFKRVLVVGAGSSGTMIIKEMRRRPEMKYDPVALIDDSKYKKDTIISGVKVLGDRYKISEIVKQKQVEEIIIAIPSIEVNQRKGIIDICKRTNCKVKIIPAIHELIEGKVSLKHIRDVEVEDLLGREPIKLDNEGVLYYLNGKRVLVTGGGGSIGSELCRQIAKYNPKQLLILDIYENNVYELSNELKYRFKNLNLKIIIASVRDKKRLQNIFSEFKPEVVFHAAAHKHVPLMEDNPTEAIKNNVFGTLNVAECADKYGTRKFVLISTDKAVNPTNIMGASKRVCEMIIQGMARESSTEFVAVRFGNVLGSNGSVVPFFKKQIAYGGPVTVTNKYITRFFMTIPEAAQLLLQAGAYAKGGEIFVLDMGKPVKIYDLACDLIRLSGFEPNKEIKIEITGRRPGEKLYEELLMAEEGLNKTKHEKIFVGKSMLIDIKALKESLDSMRVIIDNGSNEDLLVMVQELVPTFKRMKTNKKDNVKEEIAATFNKKTDKEIINIDYNKLQYQEN